MENENVEVVETVENETAVAEVAVEKENFFAKLWAGIKKVAKKVWAGIKFVAKKIAKFFKSIPWGSNVKPVIAWSVFGGVCAIVLLVWLLILLV